jgi:mono/diheme cytochrome c family protein
VRRRPLGKLPIASDGSARMQLPGGVPVLFRLPETAESKAGKWPRTQRESMAFAPGEYAHQSFRRDLFNGLCASCHGSTSGRPLDTALLPDILTQASAVDAKYKPPTNLNIPPAARGAVEATRPD